MPYYMRILLLALGGLALVSCAEPIFEPTAVADRDSDGFTVLEGDCNDLNADISPEANEFCNQIDDNCNGATDEGVSVEYFVDSDGDGFGDQSGSTTAESCEPPAGFVLNSTDCNDTNPYVNPSALEICDKASIDHNCNGKPDSEEAVDRKLYYQDNDKDGFGNAQVSTRACEAPTKYVDNNTDCNDLSSDIKPTGQPEQEGQCDGLDNNCDNLIDESFDKDGDGTADCFGTEICDGLDNNSNGLIDEGFDRDGDGFTADPENGCTCKANLAVCGKDCNDLNELINELAIEKCDGVDNDCDTVTDEVHEQNAGNAPLWFVDADEDTYGNPDPNKGQVSCNQPTGYVLDNTDCDDSNPIRSPGAPEVCDDFDNNCNQQIDEGIPYFYYYRDQDSDGFGIDIYRDFPDENTDDYPPVERACRTPEGYVFVDATSRLDCNDNESAINPDAVEYCDLIDNDCDDLIDDPSSADVSVFYEDSDADTFGNKANPISVCYLPEGYVVPPPSELGFDCDDTNDTIYPGGTEQCDGLDNNCNTKVDDNVEYLYYFPDSDDDRYGDFAKPGILSCSEPDDLDNYIGIYRNEETGEVYIDDGDNDHPYSDDDQDCNDTNPTIHPFATEYCNDVDDDCDRVIDEPDAADAVDWYLDFDVDGFGQAAVTTKSCPDTRPTGYVEARTGYNSQFDCNDANSAISPVATELCDSVDNDCDGSVDESSSADAKKWYRDSDVDGYGDPNATITRCYLPSGYVANDKDCDDTRANRNPAADELCDGVDNDCDSYVDESDSGDVNIWYQDLDGDTYGNPSVYVNACYKPNGYVQNSTDCDDSDAGVSPADIEICDALNVDEDCNGKSDDADPNLNVSTAVLYYVDTDQDSFGKLGSVGLRRCDNPSTTSTKYSLVATDCDDNDSFINPSAKEIVGDGVDQNCDTKETCYKDTDNDGYRPGANDTVASTDSDCADSGEAVATDSAGDCNDNDSAVNPTATDSVDDGVDSNCDGKELCYRDSDNDGYRPNTSATVLSSNLVCTDAAEAISTDPVGDCNDSVSGINPAATEITGDEVDQNCDTRESCFVDGDGDKYRKGSSFTVLGSDVDCADTGEVSTAYLGEDCDDTSAAVNPAATETIANGVDDNCDSRELCYLDADSDGYRPDSTSTVVSTNLSCADSGEAITTVPTGDCDDRNKNINPVATEIAGDAVDQNCDAKELCYVDGDNDAYRKGSTFTLTSTDTDCADSGEVGNAFLGEDCNDANALVNPGITETVADQVDQNCDGRELCYADKDDDGFRPDSSSTVLSTDADCTDASEAISTDPTTDCNDLNASINPSATEVVGDEVDSTCDGKELCYVDADNDGYRPTGVTTVLSTDADCADSGEALATDPSGDCSDSTASIYPTATETCNTKDDDCDTVVDEGVKTTYYADSDGDTYGSPLLTSTACTTPVGYVTNSTDCNDSNAAVKPGATETCNLTDDDCDGSVDEGLRLTYYYDKDLDTYGDSTKSVSSCSAPSGYVSTSTDCNDNNASVNPGATETCDSVDNDCDSQVDEGVKSTYYLDNDHDNYGLTNSSTSACTPPSGYALLNGDCDDTKIGVNPGATEVCNSIDDDCDSQIDESLSLTEYTDADSDGYGLTSSGTNVCTLTPGKTLVSGDCDDVDADINPGEVDICGDGTDSDCDAQGGCEFELGTDTAFLEIPGDVAEMRLGQVIETSFDFDADGSKDLLIGAPDAPNSSAMAGAGQVFVFLAPVLNTYDLGDADHVLEGAAANAHFGAALSVFDLDDDTNAELYVGAPGDGNGKVYVFEGPIAAPNPVASTSADIVLEGFNASDRFGAAVIAGTDLDDDDVPELVIGAPTANPGGKVYIYTSPLEATPISTSSADVTLAGPSGAGLGEVLFLSPDLTGDTFPELVVGSPGANSNVGGVRVYYGSADFFTNTPTSTALVPNTGDHRYGSAIALIPDIDSPADGAPELLIGAPLADVTSPSLTGAGKVYLIRSSLLAGPSVTTNNAMCLKRGHASFESLGSALVSTVSLDGITGADVLIGAPGVADIHSIPVNTTVGGVYGLSGQSPVLNCGDISTDASAYYTAQLAGTGAGWAFGILDMTTLKLVVAEPLLTVGLDTHAGTVYLVDVPY